MPIYEFRCRNCRKRTTVFVRSMGANLSPQCEHCGYGDMSRLFSRISVRRSGGNLGDSHGFDESTLAEVDENDPRSVARWVRKMSREMGEPLDPEMEADLQRMEAGEMPEDTLADEADEDFAEVD